MHGKNNLCISVRFPPVRNRGQNVRKRTHADVVVADSHSTCALIDATTKNRPKRYNATIIIPDRKEEPDFTNAEFTRHALER